MDQEHILDIVIPVFNEKLDVVRETISKTQKAFDGMEGVSIIVVDDGSSREFDLSELGNVQGVQFIRHGENRGYGAALKSGIRKGHAPLIAITDADGTYPVEELPAMLELVQKDAYDMVVGSRTGDVAEIPWMRRFPKAMLNLFASFMSGRRIMDLNSGLRIFRRDLCYAAWTLLPESFSFTSTITMVAVSGGFNVTYHAVNYYKRVGHSSIKPLRDTVRFFYIVLRLGLLFTPMKVFAPITALLFAMGAIKGFALDFPVLGYIGNLSVILMLTSVQVFMMGLLGEMIVQSRNIKFFHPRGS